MGIVAVVFFSFVAFFSVVPQIAGPRSLPEQEIVSRDLFVKNARFLHRDYIYIPPARKAIMVDAEGQAVRTADGMQMTRRDRSRKVYAPREEAKIKIEPQQAAQPDEPPFAEPAIVQDQPVIVLDREIEPARTVYAAPPLVPPALPLSPAQPVALVPTTVEEPASQAVPEAAAPAAVAAEPPVMPEPVAAVEPSAIFDPVLASVEPSVTVSPIEAAPVMEPAIAPIETVPSVAVPASPIVSAEPVQEVESLSDRAVRQVYRAVLDDPALTEGLRATLQVTAAQDVLTIRGTVPSEEEKQRFGRMAREASEGLLVENQLSVTSA